MGANSVELNRLLFRGVGDLMLTDTPGGRDALRDLVDPELRDIVDDLTPTDRAMLSFATKGFGLGDAGDVLNVGVRVRHADGRLAGTAVINKPAAGMAMLGAMTFTADLRHVARMGLVAKAGAPASGDPVRRPSGVVAPRPAPLHRQLLRARAPPGTGRRPAA